MYYIVFMWEWFENEFVNGSKIKRFKAFRDLNEAKRYCLSISDEDTTIEYFDSLKKFITFLNDVGYFIEEAYK